MVNLTENASQGNQDKAYLEKVITFLPLITVLFLGLGIVQLVVYYYPFNLDILKYIEINEIILNSLTNLIETILFLSIFVAFFILLSFILRKTLNEKKFLEFNRNDLSSKSKKIILTVLSIIVIIQYLLFLYLLNRTDEKEIILELTIYGGFLCLLLIFLFALLIYRQHPSLEKYYTIFSKSNFLIVSVWTAILIYFLFLNITESVKTKIFHSTYGTTIEIATKKIISDDNYYFIGRTRNFIFFYNEKTKFTDVYQNKDITLFSVSNKGFSESINENMKRKINQRNLLKKELDSLYKFKHPKK